MFKIQAPLVVQSPGIYQSLRAGLMTEKPVLTIRLLNTFSVRFDDREIEVINKPRLQTLLAYFLLHPDISTAAGLLVLAGYLRATIPRQSPSIDSPAAYCFTGG